MKLARKVQIPTSLAYDPEAIRRELQATPLATKIEDENHRYQMLFTLISGLYPTLPPNRLRYGRQRNGRQFSATQYPAMSRLVVTALQLAHTSTLVDIWASKSDGSTAGLINTEGDPENSRTLLFPLTGMIEIRDPLPLKYADGYCRFGEALVFSPRALANTRIRSVGESTSPRSRNTVRIMDFVGIDTCGLLSDEPLHEVL